MEPISVAEARKNLAEIINQVSYGGRRVVIARHGKAVAAVVPLNDLALITAIEDRLDLEAASRALEEPEGLAWRDLKQALGL